ncbi:phage holin family protein [Gordonia shandongensis]|uniref:phage holin family protein n=1 Tax=Gordonia shandongensis TaxID=376351 RepID=UPI00047ACC5C|nr:phage holin family protein [Gordonia shandongensis]
MSGNSDARPTDPSSAPRVPNIPMSDANLGPGGEPTIGSLVKDATASASTLFRSEIALAKSEVVREAKKAGAGGALLIVAAALLLFSSFFFFVFVGFVLDIWLPTWAAFGIVFLLLVVISLILIVAGYLFLKKLRAPEKTIESVGELSSVLPGKGGTASTGGMAHPQIPPAHDPSRG